MVGFVAICYPLGMLARTSRTAWVLGLAGLCMMAGHAACSAGADDGDYGTGGKAGSAGAAGGAGNTGMGGGISFDADTTDSELTADVACAATQLLAEAVPLNLFLMLDTSLSMTKKWDGWNGDTTMQALQQGVKGFIQDPASTGVIVSGQHFPLSDPNMPSVESCDPVTYMAPALPWSALPYPAMTSWVTGLTAAGGGTPTLAALQGAIDACSTRLNEVPNEKCAVVLVTDGMPQGACGVADTQTLTELGQSAAAGVAKGIYTFVIGFQGVEAGSVSDWQAVLTTIAQSGGTKAPVFVKDGNIGQAFQDALTKMRGAALACEYKMPDLPPGKKPTFVTVRYTAGGGAVQELKRKLTQAECGVEGGWYYDNESAPTKLIMCPGTCAALQDDLAGKVEVLVMCAEVPL